MKTKSIILSAFMALLFVPAAMAANPTETATGTATITLGTPVTVSLLTGSVLSFGSYTLPSTGDGSATVDPAGVATFTGTGVVQSGTVSAVSFEVSGKVSTAYVVTLPTAAIPLTGGPSSLYLTNLVHSTLADLDVSGKGSFKVGGTIAFPAGTADGTYTGTFDVTVAYN